MLSIAEASVLGQNDLRDGIVEMFVEESAILQLLGFLPIEGNAYQFNRELTLPSATSRAVNTTWVESSGTFQSKTEALKIYGGEAHVDRFIQQTMPATVGDHLAAQLNLKVKAVTYKVHADLVNGDTGTAPTGVDGIKKRVTAIGGAQVQEPAGTTTSLTINTDTTTRNTFLDALDALIESVRGGADALLMNASIRRQIRSVARREGFWERDRNEFGQVVETFNGVPLVDVGSDAAGAVIIPNNEPNKTAAANDTTSIYAVSFKDDSLVGLTNGGIQAYEIGGGLGNEMETKPAYGVRIEWYLGLADHNDKSIARLRYLK